MRSLLNIVLVNINLVRHDGGNHRLAIFGEASDDTFRLGKIHEAFAEDLRRRCAQLRKQGFRQVGGGDGQFDVISHG